MCPFAAHRRLTIHFPQRLNRYACISSSSWATFHSCIVEAPLSFGSRWRLVNIGGFVVLLHCLHSGQMPMIDNRAKGPSKETHNRNSIASVLWTLSATQIKLLSGFFRPASRSRLASRTTDFARILTRIMSAVKDKLNVATSKPGETSISRRTLTMIQSATSNYCIKFSWNMDKLKTTSLRHTRSLILSSGKMSLKLTYFVTSNCIWPELATTI